MTKTNTIFLILALALTACTPSNQLRVAWKTGEFTPKRYSNIGIVAVLKSDEARIDVETGLADALRAQGIHSTTTWDIWPFANKPDLIKKAGYEGGKLKEIIQQRVKEANMDALLIISLFDAFKEQRYVPGTSTSVGIGISPGAYPVYGYPYYAYFGYAFTTMSTPGYYVDASTYFTEANLYDIPSEKLIWTGQMTTEMQSSPEREAQSFGRVLVKGMIKGDVLEK